jgi:hypothetical protein
MEIFNIILIITILVIAYYCMQNNNEIKSDNITNIKEQETVENFIDLDTKYIKFDYDLRPIEKEYLKDQKDSAYLYTWYPNTWIERIDENGNPIYNSRDKVTGKVDIVIDEAKSSFSYEFNNVKTVNMSGVLGLENSQGKTIKEIYDNSMVDYKNLGPKKNRISDDTSDIVMPGGSNLEYFTADTWTYENEDANNGGLIYDNVYGDDTMSNNVAVF